MGQGAPLVSPFDVRSLGALPLAVVGAGVLVLAYLTSATIQPFVRRFAVYRGLLDLPDGERRTHLRPIPRLGGVGVFAAVLLAASIGAMLESTAHLLALLPFMVSVLVGATLLFVVGLVDDIMGVPPAMKIAVQSAAALIIWYYGFRIEILVLPGGQLVSLGMLALPVVVLWIVGLSNAFNLVDGADGLAGGVAVIALGATAISSLVLHDTAVLWSSAALIGAMLGFLRYNLPPARIFLGDSGSLVAGFLLAVLTVKGMTRHDGAVYAVGPVFALCYPLLDTGIAMLRRWLRGEPLSRADGRHIHHQLRELGLGPRQTLLLLLGLSTLVAALGVSASLASSRFTVVIAMAGLALLTVLLVQGARWLQYHELLEAGASIASVALTGRGRLQDKIYARDLARIISLANDTAELRAIIEDNASTFRFAHMQLRWGLADETPPDNIVADMLAARLWSFDYPIVPRSGGTDPLFLSVWCEVDGGPRSAGAERVTQILAPAIGRWVREHPERLRAASFTEPVRRLRLAPRTAGGDRPLAGAPRGPNERRAPRPLAERG